MRTRTLVAAVAMAGAVTLGATGVAVAAEDSGSGSASQSGAPAATVHRHPRLRLAIRRHAGRIVAQTLDVTVQDLRAALRAGQSIVEYAQSLGKDPQTVKEALVSAADKAIDAAVARGRIDESRADEIKAKVPDRVDALMNRHFGQGKAA